jgi:hypothetical protein
MLFKPNMIYWTQLYYEFNCRELLTKYTHFMNPFNTTILFAINSYEYRIIIDLYIDMKLNWFKFIIRKHVKIISYVNL